MTRVHEQVTEVKAGVRGAQVTIMSPDEKHEEVYVFINGGTAGSPSTSFHISRLTATKLGELLIRAASVKP